MAAFFLSTGPEGGMLGRLERDGRGRYGMKKGTSTWEMMEEKERPVEEKNFQRISFRV